MKNKKILLILILISLCFFASSSFLSGLLSGGELVTIKRSEYEELQRFSELNDIYNIIEQAYYEEPDYDKMILGATRGMLMALDDPYTFYYTPEELKKYWEDDSGEYAGIGIQILSDKDDLSCRVTRVFKNSPAERAGIKKGDLLIKAGDIEVNAHSLNDAVDFMRGKIGTSFNIEIKRNDEIISLDVTREKIHINLIESGMLKDGVGLIRLYEFSGESGEEFKQAFQDLKNQGMKALVLDLRDNPGGWVNNAKSIADLFIDGDTLTYFQYRNGSKHYIKTAKGKIEIPMAVLVNENSASASELLSGALQDYGIAKLVGVNTYGKGIAQEVLSLYEGDDSSGLQFTSAQYFTPKGRKVHKIGIKPDYEIQLPEEDKNKIFDFGDFEDVQLKKAFDLLK